VAIPQNTKHGNTIWSKRNEGGDPNAYFCTIFTAALFTTSIRQLQHKCLLVHEWVNKMWYTHTKKYCSTLKRREFSYMVQHEWTLKISEINGLQEDKYYVIPYILVKLIKKDSRIVIAWDLGS
jgi:hypothetical protein